MMTVAYSSCSNVANSEASSSDNISAISEEEKKDKIESVDLGLSVNWASCNIGAQNPEDLGLYFSWGEVKSKQIFTDSTYKYAKMTGYHGFFLTKYCNDETLGTLDHKLVLELEDDVAHKRWGGNWRMPTKEEIDELIKKCSWKWTTQNGIYGYIVTGTTGQSIFLPAAGEYTRFSEPNNCAEEYGFYWSSTVCHIIPSFAYYLGFFSRNRFCDANLGRANIYCERSYGRSVRPVCPRE